jgi:hypothetical protein
LIWKFHHILNMSSNVAEPDLKFSPLELYIPKWSVIATFTFFNYYSVMSCTCDFPIQRIPISDSQEAAQWYSELLLYMALYYQDTSYETFYGIPSAKNAAQRYCTNILYMNNFCSTLYFIFEQHISQHWKLYLYVPPGQLKMLNKQHYQDKSSRHWVTK